PPAAALVGGAGERVRAVLLRSGAGADPPVPLHAVRRLADTLHASAPVAAGAAGAGRALVPEAAAVVVEAVAHLRPGRHAAARVLRRPRLAEAVAVRVEPVSAPLRGGPDRSQARPPEVPLALLHAVGADPQPPRPRRPGVAGLAA